MNRQSEARRIKFTSDNDREFLEEDKSSVTISVLKERIKDNLKRRMAQASENEKLLLAVSADKISEIYLFFDADLHNGTKSGSGELNERFFQRNLQQLQDILSFFSDEMSYGKLYVSYPMAEALQDLAKWNVCCNRCVCKILIGKDYKKDFKKYHWDFLKIDDFDKNTWNFFCCHAICKTNCLFNGTYAICNYKVGKSFSQINILRKEKEVAQYGFVYVLSGFPFFLIEYFGKDRWNEWDVPIGYMLSKKQIYVVKK